MRMNVALACAAAAALIGPAWRGAGGVVSAERTDAPTTLPAEAAIPPAAAAGPAVRLRALQSVLDARERRLDWHQAAQQAEDRVHDDSLKQQLTQRLAGLVPRVAKELTAHPQDNALVSVAVYQQKADGKPAMVAVTFVGLGDQLDGQFFGDALADLPSPPKAQGIPEGLALDEPSSSYLVFFLGNHRLEAGDIPQSKMKQDIVLATHRAREAVAEHDAAAAQAEQARAANEQALLQQQQARQASAPQTPDVAGDVGGGPYDNGNLATGGIGYPDDGYYYPGVGVPIVILPTQDWNAREWRERHRAREHELEQQHQQMQQNRPTHLPRGAGVVIPPGSQGQAIVPGGNGQVITPGSAGVSIPPGSQGQQVPTRRGEAPRADQQQQQQQQRQQQQRSTEGSRSEGGRQAPAAGREAPAGGQEAPAAAHQAPTSGGARR